MITHYAGQYRDVARVFHAAVHTTAAEHYSAEQRKAWSPAEDPARWQARCELKRPWLWTQDGRVAGFIELDHRAAAAARVDAHYVHPDFARRGVGSALLRHALETAWGAGLTRVSVEASHTARPLYQRFGFSVDGPNEVVRGGVTLENWRMSLGPSVPPDRPTAPDGRPPAGPLELLTDMPPRPADDEYVQVLARGPGVRVERVVSAGHASPPGFWYEQTSNEWVLLIAGEATLAIEGRGDLRLQPGDDVRLPAGLRHRVERTSGDEGGGEPAVWLCVFWDPPPAS